MSAFEMTFLMIGIATPVVFIIAIFYTFRGSATAMKTAKVFLTREKWPGKLHNTRIVSWQQTNMFHGDNLFIDIFFHLDKPPQLHSAKALITPAQLHLLRNHCMLSTEQSPFPYLSKKDPDVSKIHRSTLNLKPLELLKPTDSFLKKSSRLLT